MFYEPKNSMERLKFYRIFSKSSKLDMSYSTDVLRSKKIRRNFEVLLYFSKSTKVDYEYDYRQSSV